MVLSPRGNPARFTYRENCSDLSVIGSTFGLWGARSADEYRLRDLHVSGLFVDVGAHVGTVAIAVLLDNPGSTAVCIEPLAENCVMIERNAAFNGVTGRLTILHAAIGKGKSAKVAHAFDGDYASERYIGNLGVAADTGYSLETVPTVLLADLGPIEAMKLDCEGCEWTALTEPCVADIRVIIGEAHHDTHWAERVVGLLDETHVVEIIDNPGATGLFRAVRR